MKQNAKKNVSLVKQNVMKPEVFIKTQKRKKGWGRERRDGGEGEERGLRKGVERG